MPVQKVEGLSINVYRELLEGCFNIAALESGMGGFKFQTSEEKTNEIDAKIEKYKNMEFAGLKFDGI